MINGLNWNYQNIPMIDNTSSVRKYNTLDDLSLAYNSIKTNNSDYYYNIKNSSSKIYSVSTVKNDASELFTRGKNLVDESNNGLFQSKTAVSSDDKKVSASAKEGALNKTYSVEVKNIAKYQSNKSNEVNAYDKAMFNVGNNTFAINHNGQTKDISFKVDASDNNEKALNSMVNAINNSDAGVKASVVKDSKTNLMYMKIDSKETGKVNSFEIVDKVGNAAAASGVSNKVQTAEDANYNVNGVNYTAKTNDISLDNGKVNLNLKENTTTPINVKVKSDTNKIKNGIENFVNSYNKFSSDIQNNDLDSNILKASTSALKRNETRLKGIGITVNEDNTLSIDKKKLNEAIENDADKVKNIFSGYTGIGKKITSAAKAVEINPNIVVQVNQNIGYNNNYAIMQSTAQYGNFLNLIR
ncbi:flagellar hook protein [Clostridium carboxidivorans P7]|uniref:Flagellar hook-associated protein 2 n=1 Tax=Clostridium carboxidivorans P7 TaxID=536227 RepID=C6Q0C5_9CLOT|nr:flagellar filament capping protein FliD [Clostridium carboxidivorans]AKN29510.1 flagellar hook protein [Clostridium carboxidivorans P7]EET85052.1 flagellar hook-associated protein 2, putative [Clostridium carboxidivorans P7]EFG89567.1 flagellar hook-associated protein 2 [Clostridium carboxidivorans P7]